MLSYPIVVLGVRSSEVFQRYRKHLLPLLLTSTSHKKEVKTTVYPGTYIIRVMPEDTAWQLAGKPRQWQVDALRAWESAAKRGIVSVVTGAGKTFFA
jgi:superfamily II DNA or RNA helicase